ncbi:IS200/IS605 family accessory protein TnpB-related protein, partial [Bacillus pacificus]
IYTFDVPFKGYNVSSEVAEQSLSVALKQVVEYALEKKKPIAYEDLDFKKKKLQLRESSKNGARLLSGFYYSRYKELLQHKCLKIGVEAIPVNPAYTSQIGHTVFMKRYGLSSHGSAACVIARRGMDLTFEKVPYACPLGYPKK